jgi:hypothetical protein
LLASIMNTASSDDSRSRILGADGRGDRQSSMPRPWSKGAGPGAVVVPVRAKHT